MTDKQTDSEDKRERQTDRHPAQESEDKTVTNKQRDTLLKKVRMNKTWQTDGPLKNVRIKCDRHSSEESDDNTWHTNHSPLEKVRITRDRHSAQEMKIKRDKQTDRHSREWGKYVIDKQQIWGMTRVWRVGVFDFGTGRVGYLPKSSGTGTGRDG